MADTSFFDTPKVEREETQGPTPFYGGQLGFYAGGEPERGKVGGLPRRFLDEVRRELEP